MIKNHNNTNLAGRLKKSGWLLAFALFFIFIMSACDKDKENTKPDWDLLSQRINRADSMAVSGDYVHALDSLHRISREISANADTPSPIFVQTYFLIGRIHSIYGDSEAAMKYYKLALQHISPDTDNSLKMRLYSNLYEVLASRGQYDKARETINAIKALDISPARRKMFHYNFSSGDLAFREGRYDDALAFYRKSIENIDGKEVPEKMLSFPYSEMAETFKKTGQNDSAFFYLKKFEESAGKESEPFVKASALRELMIWSAKSDRPEMTRGYMDQYFTFMDSLIDVRGFLRAKENIRLYEEQVSSEKIHDMSEKVSKGRRTIFNLIIVLAGVCLVTAFILIYSSTVRRNNKALYLKNQELTKIEQHYRELLTSLANEESPVAETVSENDGKADVETEDDSKREPAPLPDETAKNLLARITLEMEKSKPYLDPEFNLQTLASMVDSNTKYVSMVINDLTGLNFRTYVNNYRVKEAERRLLDRENYGQYTMQWIAESVGIKSKSTFVAAFKKATGLTPSVYMKYVKEEEKKKNA